MEEITHLHNYLYTGNEHEETKNLQIWTQKLHVMSTYFELFLTNIKFTIPITF